MNVTPTRRPVVGAWMGAFSAVLGVGILELARRSTAGLTRRALRRGAAGVFFVAWAGLAVTAGASLMASHWQTLPVPESSDPRLARALAELRPPSGDPSWLAIHVLYSKCRCSQRIFDHLFDEPRPPGVQESIVLVGADAALQRRAAQAGFELTVVSPRELEARFHVVSAPLLIALDAADVVRYAGGYTDRKQGPDIRDIAVLSALQSGRSAQELPLFGCGVSRELQELIDPLGLKYD